jgi:peptide/nickel transport system substrate-binding protein
MSRVFRRGPRAVALVAVVSGALLLAGCSGSSSPQSTGAAGNAPALAIAAVSAPNSLDTAQLVNGQQMFVWGSIYDTLLARDTTTGKLLPNAADSWAYNTDGTVLTLKLHPGMKFSNGDPADAAAVTATMLRTKNTPGIGQPYFALVSDVTAVDDATVQVTFSAYDPQFIYNLSLGAGAIGDPNTISLPAAATDPIGSGPYTLDVADSVPGTTYVLKRRADYWNAAAYPFPTLTVRVLQDPTASLNALQAGEINAGTIQPAVKAQLDTSKFSFGVDKAQSLAYLDILDRGGVKFPALGNLQVRQAINDAIDREGILKGIYSGNGQTTEQIFPPTSGVWDDSLNSTYSYDINKGRQLVQDAGYAGATFQIPSTFLTTSIEPTLSQAFSDIGLNLDWVAVPPQQAQTALTSGDYGLSFQITGINSDPADAFFHYSPNGFGNPTHYTNSTLDGFFSTINSTVDPDAVVPTYQELNKYAVTQAYEAPITFIDTTWATADGITFLSAAGVPNTVRNFQYNGK